MLNTINYRYEYMKGQIDGFDFMTSHMKLKRVGRQYKGLCPFPNHNEKSPSFTVYPAGYEDKGIKQEHTSFYCFGCSVGGDVFEFRKRLESLSSKKEALEKFEIELGIEVEDTDMQISYLKETLKKIKNSQEQILSISEINMICSSICRNFLMWVKESFPDDYINETILIDKFYAYFDFSFEEKNAIECMKLIEDVQIKITNRRITLLEKDKSLFGD